MRSRFVLAAVAATAALAATPGQAAPLDNARASATRTADVLATELVPNSGIDGEGRGRPPLLRDLVSLREGDGLGGANRDGLENLRYEAMREEAARVGTQGGLHWRYAQINQIMRQYGGQLDAAYNFGPLMMEGVVLPPVIKRITDANRKYSDREMRTVEVGYRLEHPARIVTTAPTWRSFLVRSYPPPELPADVLLPTDGKEARIWERAVLRGWRQGVTQANRNFKIALNLLTSTYLGMLQYKLLLAQEVVSAPNLATTNLRITSDGETLNIGDRIYRLTTETEFTDSSRWEPVPISPRTGGRP